MKIEITPLDTLFFKDAKPFNMSDETWADSFFPPNPSVLYGALRSVYFANHIDELDKAGSEDDPTKNLIITDIGYNIDGYTCYPVPRNIVKLKGKSIVDQFTNITPKRSNFKSSQLLINNFNTYKIQIERIENGYIKKNLLSRYLKSKIKKKNNILTGFKVEMLEDHVINESKIGITIDKNNHLSKSELLYRTNMIRLKNLKINIKFKGINIPEQGFIKLGGEGKSSYYEEIDEDSCCSCYESDNNKMFLYLSTPAIFQNGWLPNWIDEHSLEGKYKKIKLQLVTADLGNPEYIGGYDMKNGCPKPMRKAIPAGSIYYFKIREGSKKDVIEAFHNKSISEGNTSKEGFGITYIGTWGE